MKGKPKAGRKTRVGLMMVREIARMKPRTLEDVQAEIRARTPERKGRPHSMTGSERAKNLRAKKRRETRARARGVQP